MQRLGRIGAISVCASNYETVRRLAEAETIARAFPGQSFRALPQGPGPRQPELYRDASPMTYFTKQTGPVLFLCGELDNPERDTAGMEKLKSLGVPTKQIVLKDATTLDEPGIQALIARALKYERVKLDGTSLGRIVIKSISAKQRPRRPA